MDPHKRKDREFWDTETWDDGHMTMEAEIWVMWPQAQGYLEAPVTWNCTNDPLLETPEGPQTAHTSTLNLWPPNMHSYCCRPPVCGTLLGQPQKTNTVSVNEFLQPPRTQHASGVVRRGSTGLQAPSQEGCSNGAPQQPRTRPTRASLGRAPCGVISKQPERRLLWEWEDATHFSTLPLLPMRGSPRHTLCCAVLSHSVVSDSLRPLSPSVSSVHGDSPGRNTGVGCHALFQGIFSTQGLNPGLPHRRLILHCLICQGTH